MQLQARKNLTLLLLLVLLGLTPLASADWTAWRNTDRDGKSEDTGLLKEWPEGGPAKLWELNDIGSGFSTVILVDGIVYTTGHKDKRLILQAISADGKHLWSKDIGEAYTANWPGTRSTPTYDEGLLYLESGVGVVGCYDAKTGDTKWTRTLQEWDGKLPGWGFAESVLILGDLAVITPGGKACMVALDKKTGKTVWESGAFDEAHYCSPLYFEFNKVPMIVNGTKGGLVCVNAKTGKILWTNDFAANNVANCPTPAYEDGYVFWSVGYGKGAVCVKMVADGDSVKAEEAYRTKDMVSHHGGYIILDGNVYGNHNNGFTCLDLKTGAKKWFEKAVGKGSLCYADGMLYLFGEKDGLAGLGAASPEGFKMTGQFSVKGEGPSWAYPVVAGGKLFLRYDTNLYCYDVKAK